MEGNSGKAHPTEDSTELTTPKRPSLDQFFKSRDRNNDGTVTLAEFIGNPKGRNVPALTKRFKRLDSNSDGELQRDELGNL